MELIPTTIAGVFTINLKVYGDCRGEFSETYNQKDYADAGILYNFVQDNQSRSWAGVLRGLHFQIGHEQGKLVRVLSGYIYDVVADIRPNSKTLGKWQGFHLHDRGYRVLWVPPGLAHGFYVLSEYADVLYKTTDFYHPECERTLLWNDQTLSIQWPLINGKPPIMSDKDRQGLGFNEIMAMLENKNG